MYREDELIDGISGVSASIDNLRESHEREAKDLRRDVRRTAVDPDLLTEEEVEELRRLIGCDGELREYCRSRIEANGRKQRGLYNEFGRLGLTVNEDKGSPFYLTSNAYWAVEKHDQRAAERERELKRQWRHDLRIAALGTVVGGLMGIFGTLLGVLIEHYLLS